MGFSIYKNAIMKIEEIYKIFQLFPQISTDSRNILPDSLFFALKGDNFNGNSFAEKAIDQGAVYAIIDDANYKKNEKYILVLNVLQTLQQLAAYHRTTLNIPVIGITGTNGKTTTKELLNAVLSFKYKTLATYGNLNNHIGVPLTLLSITNEHEIAIIEMGANHIGEIAELCEICSPDFGIITNIGKAHLDGFGGLKGVITTKYDLYKAIQKKKGKIFVNLDNELLVNLSAGIQSITYGDSPIAYCKGKLLKLTPYLSLEYSDYEYKEIVNTQLIGDYNFENILAAITIGLYFKVNKFSINKAIEAYRPKNSRSQILKKGSNTIVLDAYNANPTSLEASIRNFSVIESRKKVLIIGDMLELGKFSKEEHLSIIDFIKLKKFTSVFLVGQEFSEVCNESQWKCFPNSEIAKAWFMQNPIKNAFILIKGSRGIKLENVFDAL